MVAEKISQKNICGENNGMCLTVSRKVAKLILLPVKVITPMRPYLWIILINKLSYLITTNN